MKSTQILLTLVCLSTTGLAEPGRLGLSHETRSITKSVFKGIRDSFWSAEIAFKDLPPTFLDDCHRAIYKKYPEAAIAIEQLGNTPNEGELEKLATGCMVKSVAGKPVRPVIEIARSSILAKVEVLQSLCQKGIMPHRIQPDELDKPGDMQCTAIPKNEQQGHDFFLRTITCLGKSATSLTIAPAVSTPTRCTANTVDQGKTKIDPMSVYAGQHDKAIQDLHEVVCRQGIEFSRLTQLDIKCTPSREAKAKFERK